MNILRAATLICLTLATPAFAEEAPKAAVAAAEAPKAVEAPKAEAAPAAKAEAAPAAAKQMSPEEVVALGKTILDAAKGGNWGLAVAGILMLLVWGLRKFFLKKIPSSYMPWVAAGTGIAGAVAANLQAGQAWGEAILSGLMAGAAASGLYSMIGKKFLGGPVAAEEPAAEEEEEEAVAGESVETEAS